MSETGEAAPLDFKIFGLPFLAVALYLILDRFFHDAWLRQRTVYAVTDQRVLIVRGSKLTSLEIARLPRLELSENGDGSGTLAFEQGGSAGIGRNRGWGWWVPALDDAAQFFRIESARSVYELIRKQGV